MFANAAVILYTNNAQPCGQDPNKSSLEMIRQKHISPKLASIFGFISSELMCFISSSLQQLFK